jgi:hypothetical protein
VYDIITLSNGQIELSDFGPIKRIEIPRVWSENREPVAFRMGTYQVVFFCKIPVQEDSSEYFESKLHFFWQEKPKAKEEIVSAFRQITSSGACELPVARYAEISADLPLPGVDAGNFQLHSMAVTELKKHLLVLTEASDTNSNDRSLDLLMFDEKGRRLQIYFACHDSAFQRHRQHLENALASIVWHDTTSKATSP